MTPRHTKNPGAAGRPGAVRTSPLANDLAGLDARRAHVDALVRAADNGADGLDVRVPAAAGAAVRVRDVVAEPRPLAAYVADGSHGSLQSRGLIESAARAIAQAEPAVNDQPSENTQRHGRTRTERQR